MAGVGVAVDAALRDRHPAELGVPGEQRLVEHAARLQVGHQAGDRQVGLGRVLRVVLDEVAVRVPGVGVLLGTQPLGCTTSAGDRLVAGRNTRRVGRTRSWEYLPPHEQRGFDDLGRNGPVGQARQRGPWSIRSELDTTAVDPGRDRESTLISPWKKSHPFAEFRCSGSLAMSD